LLQTQKVAQKLPSTIGTCLFSDKIANFTRSEEPGYYTITNSTLACVEFYYEIEALYSGKEADMIYLDFSKAFVSVSHQKLLFKLEPDAISGSSLNWFSDYLNERSQPTSGGQRSHIFLPLTLHQEFHKEVYLVLFYF
jgi:hypothetical protein